MANRINRDLFDESKIIKKNNLPPIPEKIEEINVEEQKETNIEKIEDQNININIEKKPIKSTQQKKNLKDLDNKSKEYLNIVENEKNKIKKMEENKKIEEPKKVESKVQYNNSEQVLILQEANSMLELTKKSIIKTTLEIQIYKELYQSEHQKNKKALYESKLKLLGEDLNYFEKRKTIIERIIGVEINKK